MLTFRLPYFIITLLLFITEVVIALYVHDKIIRPYIGDFLVVILLYCFVRTFCKAAPLNAAIGVLIFAYGIEVLQYLQLVKRLGLQHSKLAVTIIGSSFEWIDMLAYTAGIALVLVVEKSMRANHSKAINIT